jgi:hypothetical protein
MIVFTEIRLVRASPEGHDAWNKILEKLENLQRGRQHEVPLGLLFADNPEDIKNSLVCARYGVRDALATDFDDDAFFVQSHWTSVSYEFVNWLSQQIGKVDKSVLIETKFDSITPPYCGVASFSCWGNDWVLTIEEKEIVERMVAEDSDLAEEWDADTCSWKDDGMLLDERIWEWMERWQEECLREERSLYEELA